MATNRWWILSLAVLVAIPALSALPAAEGAPTRDSPSVVALTTPPHISGTVTNCTSTATCVYAFNNSKGTGWANSTENASYVLTMALQLPGESKASYNLQYSTYIALLTGTYTYWTVGNFVGTDVNTGNVVYGTTNTNYTITCVGHSGKGGGCTYTYTTDNGTIVVDFTKAEITSTSISCSSTSTSPGVRISCTVAVTNGWNASKYPTGHVTISSGRTGTVSNKGVCTLANGTCKFTYTPFDSTCGTVVLTATYPGTTAFFKSSASIDISVVVSGGC